MGTSRSIDVGNARICRAELARLRGAKGEETAEQAPLYDGLWQAGACLYSGRPNPVWCPVEAEVAALIGIWERLESMAGCAVKQSHLGYAGCWLDDSAGRHWHAFDGCVVLSESGKTTARFDAAREFESRLIASAPVGTFPEGFDPSNVICQVAPPCFGA